MIYKFGWSKDMCHKILFTPLLFININKTQNIEQSLNEKKWSSIRLV